MDKIDSSNLPLVIKLESKDYSPQDSEWQEECRQLYVQIKRALDTGTVEPLKVETEEKGHRGGFLETFDMLTVKTGVEVMVLVGQIVMHWYQRRKDSTEITLKFPDGGEMRISAASKDDILSLYEKHIAKYGK
ncbi:MAG: hypothetical protein HYW01_01440 [Deltaproteobacteria bacterium]|nr:hypothetical protein [Deltaproteobacteria bacterium]